MSIGTAMLSAFILLCAACLIVGLFCGLIWVLIWVLYDHPVVLGTVFFGLFWAFITWWFMLSEVAA